MLLFWQRLLLFLLLLLLRCRCHGLATSSAFLTIGKLTRLRASSRSVSASIFIALFGFFRAAKNLRLCPLSAAATPAICIVSAVILFLFQLLLFNWTQGCQVRSRRANSAKSYKNTALILNWSPWARYSKFIDRLLRTIVLSGYCHRAQIFGLSYASLSAHLQSQ